MTATFATFQNTYLVLRQLPLKTVMNTCNLRLSGNHTVTECEMSGEPYSQKSGWKNYSGNDIQISIHSDSCIICNDQYCCQSLIGDWERITVADPEGVKGVLPPPCY